MLGLGQLAHLFMQASGAGKFAAPGGAPNFGDALQGIGHSLKQHYLGTPENIPTAIGGTNVAGLPAGPPAKPTSPLELLAKMWMGQQQPQQEQPPTPLLPQVQMPPPLNTSILGMGRPITPWTLR